MNYLVMNFDLQLNPPIFLQPSKANFHSEYYFKFKFIIFNFPSMKFGQYHLIKQSDFINEII